MRRILFYTDTPMLGGAENQMLLLAKFLPKNTYSVTLACDRAKALNGWCQKFMEIGVAVHRLQVFHKHDPRHYLYLKKLLPNADLMHLHIWNPASCRYGFLAAGNIPIVVTEHDPFPLRGIKKWLKDKLTERARAVIVASNAAGKIVADENSALASKIHMIPNGIDTETWRSAAALSNRLEFRQTHFRTHGNETVLLCAAELHERKGQQHLIRAVISLLPEFPRLKLVFAGDGKERKYYERIAAPLGNHVVFLGRKKEIAPLMAAADLFVLPSIREAFGLVLLEAGSLGLPVIATRAGGISEIIEDGKTGVLTEPGNTPALAEALRTLLIDPVRAAGFGKNLASRVEENFQAKEMAEKTGAVYDTLLA